MPWGYVSLSQKIVFLARKHASINISVGEPVKGIFFSKILLLFFDRVHVSSVFYIVLRK